jgi:hypothetical protein
MLDLTATDPDGDPLTFAWTKLGPTPAAHFSSATIEDPMVSFPVAGTYQLQVVVSDNRGGSATATTTVTVPITGSFSIRTLLAANDSAVPGVPVSLHWNPAGSAGNLVGSGASDASGGVEFSGLAGDPDDFKVVVNP